MVEGAAKFYSSKAWRDLSYVLRIKSKGKCARCGKVFDISKLAAHHVEELTEEKLMDASISLNPENIEIICHRCHNEEHRRFGFQEKKVYLVYGSPCSGKTSWVEEQKTDNDIIIDMDKLYQAITGLPLHTKPDALRFNVFKLRDAMLDMIYTRYGKWQDAYVIGGYPRKGEREELAVRLGAEQIHIEADKETCLLRAKERPNGYEQYVLDWFDKYER